MNTLKGQSERLSYMNFLLVHLNKSLDSLENDQDKDILVKMSKNAKILVELTELEKEENDKLPKKFIRDVYNLKDNIDAMLKKLTE